MLALSPASCGFGKGGCCDVYDAPRLGEDAVLSDELRTDGRGRTSGRRGVCVDIFFRLLACVSGETCCCASKAKKLIRVVADRGPKDRAGASKSLPIADE